LKWEEAHKFDLRIGFKDFFKTKYHFILNYFIDTRADLVIPFDTVSGIGAAAPGSNAYN
jgi:hypothetical protein